jgi:hypothetical protein
MRKATAITLKPSPGRVLRFTRSIAATAIQYPGIVNKKAMTALYSSAVTRCCRAER